MANPTLQKRCLCCGAVSPDSAATCPKCGEGSWMAVIVPAPVAAPVDTAPVAVAAPAYSSSYRGRK
jgi:hypothetical protein